MKAFRTMFAAMAVALFILPATASAQSIFVGGGVTIPSGDYGDYAKTGWIADAGVTFDIGEQGLWVYGEGFYGSNKHDDDSGDKTNVYGAMGGVGYEFDTGGSLGIYVFGGAGLMVHQYKPDTGDSDSESKFGYEGGAGVDFPLGDRIGLWVEGRFMGSKDTNFFGILAGLGFDLGGGDGM